MTTKTINDGAIISDVIATTTQRKSNALFQQLLRFLAVGGTSVAIDCLSYFYLCRIWEPGFAKAASYILGMIFGFIGNKYWTFESERKSIAEPVNYVILYAFTLAVNVGINSVTLFLLGPSFSLIAFLVATGITTVTNFIGMRYWTFQAGAKEDRMSCSRS